MVGITISFICFVFSLYFFFSNYSFTLSYIIKNYTEMLTHLCITMFTSGSAQKKRKKRKKGVDFTIYHFYPVSQE